MLCILLLKASPTKCTIYHRATNALFTCALPGPGKTDGVRGQKNHHTAVLPASIPACRLSVRSLSRRQLGPSSSAGAVVRLSDQPRPCCRDRRRFPDSRDRSVADPAQGLHPITCTLSDTVYGRTQPSTFSNQDWLHAATSSTIALIIVLDASAMHEHEWQAAVARNNHRAH